MVSVRWRWRLIISDFGSVQCILMTITTTTTMLTTATGERTGWIWEYHLCRPDDSGTTSSGDSLSLTTWPCTATA
jgi:hypothetical protein